MGGGQKLRDRRAVRAAGVADGGGLTYVGVVQQLHDPHLPEELQQQQQRGVGHVEPVSASLVREQTSAV